MSQDKTPATNPSDAHAANASPNVNDAHLDVDLTDEELNEIAGGAGQCCNGTHFPVDLSIPLNKPIVGMKSGPRGP